TGGSYTLTATFTPADPVHFAPATAEVSLNVLPSSSLTLDWATPAPIAYGTLLSGAELDAAASIPGTFAYTPDAGAVLDAGTQTLSTTFSPEDSVNYTQ